MFIIIYLYMYVYVYFIFLIFHCLLTLDFAKWNRETIRNRIKSLRAAAAKAKANAAMVFFFDMIFFIK